MLQKLLKWLPSVLNDMCVAVWEMFLVGSHVWTLGPWPQVLFGGCGVSLLRDVHHREWNLEVYHLLSLTILSLCFLLSFEGEPSQLPAPVFMSAACCHISLTMKNTHSSGTIIQNILSLLQVDLVMAFYHSNWKVIYAMGSQFDHQFLESLIV